MAPGNNQSIVSSGVSNDDDDDDLIIKENLLSLNRDRKTMIRVAFQHCLQCNHHRHDHVHAGRGGADPTKPHVPPPTPHPTGDLHTCLPDFIWYPISNIGPIHTGTRYPTGDQLTCLRRRLRDFICYPISNKGPTYIYLPHFIWYPIYSRGPTWMPTSLYLGTNIQQGTYIHA